MHQFQKLTVWQKSMELAKVIYKETKSFPSEERFGLTSQMRRAVVSIPSNIAEGSGRNTSGEFKQFLGVASGSASELMTQNLLAVAFGYLSLEKSEFINAELAHILNMIQRLQDSLS